jgi:thiamine transport system substrate-binding protein
MKLKSIKKFSKTLIIILLMIATLFIVLSCGEESSNKKDDTENLDSQKTKSDNNEYPKKAVVYVYDSFTDQLKEKIKTHIKNEYGVDVRFDVFKDTGPMIASIIKEKSDPKADLIIGIDNSFGLEILDEDVLLEYKPEKMKLSFKELQFDKTNRLTPYDYGYVALNYNSKAVESVPETLEELTQDKYKNEIAIMSPITSSTGRIFLLETIARYGEDGYLDFWKRLKPSITNITSGWSDAYYGLYISGESSFVVSYATSPPVHVIYEDTEQYKAIIFDDKAYAQIEACGIVKGAKNEYIAKRIVDYIVSVDFQNEIPQNQFMYPVNPEADLPEVFKKYAPKPNETLFLNTKKVSKNLEKWIRDWENTILK